jgi:hypothetical protein
MTADRKATSELTNYYVKLWEAKYGSKPNTNRFASHWNFSSVLDHLNKQQVKDLLDFYFTTDSKRRHDLDWFFWNYEKLMEGLRLLEKDLKHREKLREETRIRTQKWKERYGVKGITDS